MWCWHGKWGQSRTHLNLNTPFLFTISKTCIAISVDCTEQCGKAAGCCIGENWDMNDSAGDLVQCYNTDLGSADEDKCLTRAITSYGVCSDYYSGLNETRREVDKKFDTLKTWLDTRTSCAAAIRACTGQTDCSLGSCKPATLEFTYTVRQRLYLPACLSAGLHAKPLKTKTHPHNPIHTNRTSCCPSGPTRPCASPSLAGSSSRPAPATRSD